MGAYKQPICTPITSQSINPSSFQTILSVQGIRTKLEGEDRGTRGVVLCRTVGFLLSSESGIHSCLPYEVI